MAVPDFALTPVRSDSIDVGEDEPVTVFDNTLWLVKNEQGLRAAIYFSRHRPIQGSPTASIEIAFRPSPDTAVFVDQTFTTIADAIANTRYFRNKVLSFENKEHFAGEAGGITVHRLAKVRREDVILSKATTDALDLHVFEFARTRAALATLGQSLQKGILLYGPPGTGKTHTIRYLVSNLENHTTFLITANQVGKLREYIEMARLLQPATIVIEDVDLIGRDRTQMREAKEEALLNRLLNEMDGLNPSSQIFFILTTNRPADIEEAISNRPGRIDQAIEVPAPDAECRLRLLKLYGKALEIPDDVAEAAVRQTEGVSAAFMKELVRRLAQQSIMRGDAGRLVMLDLQKVVDEIATHDGTIGRTLLGGMVRERSIEVKRGPASSRC
jgi:cell division protease FtsH